MAYNKYVSHCSIAISRCFKKLWLRKLTSLEKLTRFWGLLIKLEQCLDVTWANIITFNFLYIKYKFSGTWLNMVPMLQLLTMMLNCPLILLNQMRWKTCFSRILMHKVRCLGVVLLYSKLRVQKLHQTLRINGKTC